MTTHVIAIPAYQPLIQSNACCKCENNSRCSHSYLEPWWGRLVTLIGKALALSPKMRTLDNPNAPLIIQMRDTTLGTARSDTIQLST